MKPYQILKKMFSRDFNHYHGVRPINVYLLRLVFTLTFLFVGMASWTTIINHEGEWNTMNAVAWSVWGAYSALAIFGIYKPLKMLPIMVFQIFYKLIWLVIVAFPLWLRDELTGSNAENMTNDFLWVILPIMAMPWAYFFNMFVTKNPTFEVSQTPSYDHTKK